MEKLQITNYKLQNKNIAKLLKRRLPVPIFKLIRKTAQIAQAKEYSVYIVGGFVRDLLLGVENLDLDIVVQGDAILLAKLIKKQLKATLRIYPKFGTATLGLSSTYKIDFATARREKYAYPAALPKVSFSSIEDDLFRRDFTINTLAVKINKGDFGELLNLFNGISDLRDGKVRILHKNSFIDDPTRIFRAIRFEQRYNFKIEPKTIKLIGQAKAFGVLGKLSRFRLGREFILLLKEKNSLGAIARLDQLCGLKLIHPKIKLDKAELKKAASSKSSDSWTRYFAVLTRKLTQQELKELCCDFCLTKADKQRLITLRRDNGTRTYAAYK